MTQGTTRKILVVGIGAVGGFYGGLLARKYAGSAIEIYFLSRSRNLDVIHKKGLQVIDKDQSYLCNPYLASDDAQSIGVMDYIVLATKNYDLTQSLDQIRPCVGAHTVLLPLLNGVQAFEEVQNTFTENQVFKGCTYIVSRLIKPGVVENKSGRQRLVFGIDTPLSPEIIAFEKILKDAGIQAKATSDITNEIWQKYSLVSASASATTYFNQSIGQVVLNHPETLKGLLEEITQIARAKQVGLPKDIVQVVFDRLQAIPFESTTSMHSDFLAHKSETELDLMTGYVVEQGKLLGIEVPLYQRIYAYLQQSKDSQYPFND